MAALPQGFLIRPAYAADVPAVGGLESMVFSDPWPTRLYLQEVGQPLRFQRVVCDAEGRVAAYLFASWQADELHILKVATHPGYQRQGLATVLLHAARAAALQRHGRGLVLEVRPSNQPAIRVYRRLGYELLGRRPKYYADGEDALVMYLSLQDTPERQREWPQR